MNPGSALPSLEFTTHQNQPFKAIHSPAKEVIHSLRNVPNLKLDYPETKDSQMCVCVCVPTPLKKKRSGTVPSFSFTSPNRRASNKQKLTADPLPEVASCW